MKALKDIKSQEIIALNTNLDIEGCVVIDVEPCPYCQGIGIIEIKGKGNDKRPE